MMSDTKPWVLPLLAHMLVIVVLVQIKGPVKINSIGSSKPGGIEVLLYPLSQPKDGKSKASRLSCQEFLL